MQFSLRDAYGWLPQAVMSGRGDEPVCAVSTDSRHCVPGDLYVALRGERFDGHDFVADVLARGIRLVVVERDLPILGQTKGVAWLRVADCRQALGWIAAGWRRRFQLPLIAVTGSNGKTTVKEMIAAILRADVGEAAAFATRGNLNNEIGVPQTLLNLGGGHRAGVVELGMNHPGEIAWLARIAAPTAAVVTNAQREHQEFLDGPEATAVENGAVFAALPADGTAVFPIDDLGTPIWRGQTAGRKVVTFGLAPVAGDAAGAANVPAPAQATVEAAADARPARFAARIGDATVTIELAIAGRHNVRNALAAAAASHAIGVPAETIAAGLARFRPAPGRLERRALGVISLIDDTYNANPDSVRAAIDLLADEAGPRLLILGDMGEVGDQGPAFHAEVGGHAGDRGLDAFICVGAATAEAARAFGPAARHFSDFEAFEAARLAEGAALLAGARTVLVKGSRFMRMERVVKALVAAEAGSVPPAAGASGPASDPTSGPASVSESGPAPAFSGEVTH